MNAFLHFYPFPKNDFIPVLLHWASQKFNFLAYFEGNGHSYPQAPFENLFFAGDRELSEAELFDKAIGGQKVGILGYDFKNQVEELKSENPEFFHLPSLCFFEPKLSIKVTEDGFYSK